MSNSVSGELSYSENNSCPDDIITAVLRYTIGSGTLLGNGEMRSSQCHRCVSPATYITLRNIGRKIVAAGPFKST